jgi:hydroxylamine reductase (hybrid-cluster protein)
MKREKLYSENYKLLKELLREIFNNSECDTLAHIDSGNNYYNLAVILNKPDSMAEVKTDFNISENGRYYGGRSIIVLTDDKRNMARVAGIISEDETKLCKNNFIDITNVNFDNEETSREVEYNDFLNTSLRSYISLKTMMPDYFSAGKTPNV